MSATTKDLVKCPDCGTTWDTKRQPYNECPVCGRPTSSPLGRQESALEFIDKMRSYFQSFVDDAVRPDEWIMREWVRKCDAILAANPTPVSVGGEETKK